MEYKNMEVGEIRDWRGRRFKAVKESEFCKGCDIQNKCSLGDMGLKMFLGLCVGSFREDHTTIVFKELIKTEGTDGTFWVEIVEDKGINIHDKFDCFNFYGFKEFEPGMIKAFGLEYITTTYIK